MNLLLFPLFAFFLFVASDFITVLFTKQYVASIPLFRIALLSILFASINTGVILNAYAETRYQMYIGFFRLGVAMLTLYVFVKIWGVVGAVVADILVMVFFRVIILHKVARVLGIAYKNIIAWKENGLILCISLLSGVPLLFMKKYLCLQPLPSFLLSCPVYFAFYGIISVMMNTVSPHELSSFVENVLNRVPFRKS